jgi:hypothetical protein
MPGGIRQDFDFHGQELHIHVGDEQDVLQKHRAGRLFQCWNGFGSALK